jgi:hypothetical protein
VKWAEEATCAGRYSITALDSILWLSMPVLVYDSIKRGIAIIAALGMLAAPNSLAEIIDYHQHLYSPQAGARFPFSSGSVLA